MVRVRRVRAVLGFATTVYLLAAAGIVAVTAADPLHDAIAAGDVADHLNSKVVVCGIVLAVRQTPGNPPQELAFDIGDPGGPPGLTVVIPAVPRKTFSPVFDRYIERRQVCVEGKPQAKAGGLPTVEVDTVTGFRFMGALPPPPDGFARGVTNSDDLTDPSDVRPTLVRLVNPTYTSDAMRLGVEGDVQISAVVDSDGRISNLWPTRSLDPFFGLDDKAIAAARNWTFSPAVSHGRAIPVTVTLQLQFRMHNNLSQTYPVALQVATPQMAKTTGQNDEPEGFGLNAFRVGQTGVMGPSLRVRAAPRYPLDALQQNVQGVVLVDVVVAATGRVARTRIAQSFKGSLPSLEAEAQRCVREWTFLPGTLNGQPVDVWAQALVDFHLRR